MLSLPADNLPDDTDSCRVPGRQQRIFSMQRQVRRHSRSFCLDPFPFYLHQQFVALPVCFAEVPFFGVNGMLQILQRKIADRTRSDLHECCADIFHDILHFPDVDLIKDGILTAGIAVNFDSF